MGGAMKIKIGAIVVLVATLSVMIPGFVSSPYERVRETVREILSAVFGLTGYAVIILGVLSAHRDEKRVAMLVALVLLLPALIIASFGANLIWLGSRYDAETYWLRVLYVALAFGVLWAVVWFVQLRRRKKCRAAQAADVRINKNGCRDV
jgi:uncharacterized membrane protein YfcA